MAKIPIKVISLPQHAMPHIIIEHSSSLTNTITSTNLLRQLHQELQGIESFSLKDFKSRLLPYNDFMIGDGSPSRQFCHVQFLLLPGRKRDVLRQAAAKISALLTSVLPASVEITLEVREFDIDLYFKRPSAI